MESPRAGKATHPRVGQGNAVPTIVAVMGVDLPPLIEIAHSAGSSARCMTLRAGLVGPSVAAREYLEKHERIVGYGSQ